MKNPLLLLTLLLTLGLLPSCGGGDDDDNDDQQREEDSTGGNGTTGSTGTNTTGTTGTTGSTGTNTTGTTGSTGTNTTGTTGTTGSTGTTGTTGGLPPTSFEKPIFSLWRRNSDGALLDLRGGRFGSTVRIRFDHSLGSTCTCWMSVEGNERSGNFRTYACSWNNDGPGDPGCFEQGTTSRYDKTGSFMTWVCRAGPTPVTCGQYTWFR